MCHYELFRECTRTCKPRVSLGTGVVATRQVCVPESRPGRPRKRCPCTESTGSKNSHHQKRRQCVGPLSPLPQPAVLHIRFSRAPLQFTTHLFLSPPALLNFRESSPTVDPFYVPWIDKSAEVACSSSPTLSAAICARVLFVWPETRRVDRARRALLFYSRAGSSSLTVSPRSFTCVLCLTLSGWLVSDLSSSRLPECRRTLPSQRCVISSVSLMLGGFGRR